MPGPSIESADLNVKAAKLRSCTKDLEIFDSYFSINWDGPGLC
jgi:hypothetical protein